PPAIKDSWISQPHEDEEWPGSIVSPARQGPQARLCEARLPRLISRRPCSRLTQFRSGLSRSQFPCCLFQGPKPKISAASTPSQRFPRDVRLLRRADFQRVYESGRRHFSDSMTAFYLLRDVSASEDKTGSGSGPRIGITVGRVLGKAVDRVRIKRRIRNA